MIEPMGRLYVLLFLLQIALAAAALISCLSAEEGDINALPRVAWVLIILFFPLIGSIAWFAAGRTRGAAGPAWRVGGGFPDRRPRRPVAPDDDPEFLRSLRPRPARDPKPPPGTDAGPPTGTNAGPPAGTNAGSPTGPPGGTDAGPPGGTDAVPPGGQADPDAGAPTDPDDERPRR
jgi:hypothetical protein